MPPFIDHVQFLEAVSNQAVPHLEAIAANNNLRSLRRFERDDPPPYESSTDSEYDYVDLHPPPRGGPIPEELIAIMEAPLSDDEIGWISTGIAGIVDPDYFYYREAKYEEYRFEQHVHDPPPEIFKELNGARRMGVIVRHNVKRR